MTPSNLPDDSAAAFAEISRQLMKAPSVEETFQTIVALSVDAVGGCDAAAITYLGEEGPMTQAWTEPAVLEIDELQYETGQGPCLDAIVQQATVLVEDLPADRRWPELGRRTADTGMHSVLSVKLGVDETLGSLNLYSRTPGAYDEEDRVQGEIFATHAGLALEAKTELERTMKALEVEQSRLEKLQIALVTRDVIGQAKGVLMHRHRITADRAFSELKDVSQRLNIKLRDIAQRVVDTGEMPHSAF